MQPGQMVGDRIIEIYTCSEGCRWTEERTV